jgi:hypothetical protein
MNGLDTEDGVSFRYSDDVLPPTFAIYRWPCKTWRGLMRGDNGVGISSHSLSICLLSSPFCRNSLVPKNEIKFVLISRTMFVRFDALGTYRFGFVTLWMYQFREQLERRELRYR